MNRVYNPILALPKQVCILHAIVAIGGTGAPTLSKYEGIASISRTGTGAYTITLSDAYSDLYGFMVTPRLATGAAIVGGQLTSTTPTADIQAKTVKFGTLSATGTLADPDSGASLHILIVARRSSYKVSTDA